MAKKQITKRTLAGVIALLTIGNLSGCKTEEINATVNPTNSLTDNADINMTVYLGGKYHIRGIMANKNEDGTYEVPDDYILVGNMGYMVEYVFSYPASEKKLEDGTKIYFDPNGGHIVNGMVIVVKKLSKEEATEYLKEKGFFIGDNQTRVLK